MKKKSTIKAAEVSAWVSGAAMQVVARRMQEAGGINVGGCTWKFRNDTSDMHFRKRMDKLISELREKYPHGQISCAFD